MRLQTPRTKKVIGQSFDSLHHTTKRMLNLNKNDITTVDEFNQSLQTLMSNPEDINFKGHVSGAFSKLHNDYSNYIEEEKLINRMEKKAQIRNTFFRGLTTLVIGFSIMAVYWTANYFGIPMPLLRVPV